MSPWVKFGCFITGWNRNILANCTEASHKALKKYTSSMFILILLWAFTGYCFIILPKTWTTCEVE